MFRHTSSELPFQNRGNKSTCHKCDHFEILAKGCPDTGSGSFISNYLHKIKIERKAWLQHTITR